MALKKGEILFPGIEEEVALEQAKGTISNIVDAIVELVTNSDDSYISLEKDGKEVAGRIEIYIERQKGNILKELRITDQANGMPPARIEEILRYGRRTSNIYKGFNVRGIFGRGLKESIIALGTGEIISISEGTKTHGKYYWDYNVNKSAWKTINIEGTSAISGTTIIIRPHESENVDCPRFETFIDRIENHFALRDILSYSNRKVNLILKQMGLKKESQLKRKSLKYKPQTGQQIENNKLYLSGLGVAVFKIFESNERLYYSRNDPTSKAGLVIKTTNVPLENQLFGFDNDPDAHYFFGEIYVPGISEKIRNMERGFIKSDRSGLNWNHKFCKELENKIKPVLSHHIERKKKQHESDLKKFDMPEERIAKIKKLVRKLNKLGRELLGEDGVGPDIISDSSIEINQLRIFPTEASSPPNVYRSYSVYNKRVSSVKEREVNIGLDEPKGKFVLSNESIKLHEHKKVNELLIGNFKIKGFKENDKTGIIVKQGAEEDISEFMVG